MKLSVSVMIRPSFMLLMGLSVTPSAVIAQPSTPVTPQMPSPSSIDSFLQSIDIDPAAVSTHAKEIHGGASLACVILGLTNRTEVVTPADGTVYTADADMHASQTAWEHPLCIYTPDDVDGIVLGLKVATFLDAQFAVRSGGHSPLPGWASTDDGLLISLAGIKDLDYDATSQTQRSGFGNRWGDVYNHTTQYGRVVVGGRVGTVGLGLVLGGGLSHTSNLYGWSVQNVISYELVLANGTIIKASATEHPDLFFAIKVGQNNFGIVTHVTQATFPVGKCWGGVMVFPGNYSEQFLAAMADYQAKGQFDTKSAMLPYIALNSDVIIQQYAYLDAVERPNAFEAFYDIPVLQDTTQIFDSFYDMVTVPLSYTLARYVYAATTIYLDKEAYVGAARIVGKYKTAMENVTDGDLLIMPQPISLSMVESSRARDVDPMNVTAEPQLWFTLSAGWSRQEDDAQAARIMLEALAEVEEYTKSLNVYDPFQFPNDAYSTQKPLHSFGTDTYAKLKAVGEEYDPTRVFQRLVRGGFKLE